MLVDEVLRGEQIYLRALREEDVSEEYASWLNDKLINQYLENRYTTHSKESCMEFVKSVSEDQSSILFGIFCNIREFHIGNIKIGPINRLYSRATIGLLIGNRDYWGKGIAAEAICLVSNYAFNKLGLHKLDAGCYSSNVGSKKAFLKAGYEVEGVLRDHFRVNSNFEDSIWLGRINNEGPPK